MSTKPAHILPSQKVRELFIFFPVSEAIRAQHKGFPDNDLAQKGQVHFASAPQ